MSGPSDPQLAAAQARILQLDAELQLAQRNIADLTTALESNRDIGAAIGIVMVTRGIESQAAFDLLRRASQSRHAKLRDVARDVVRRRGLDNATVAASEPVRQPLPRRPVPTPPSLLRQQVVDVSQERPRVSG
jgi:tetrahydromethanopterin S-methyltransferase subunit F